MPISTIEEFRETLKKLAVNCLEKYTGEDKDNSFGAKVKALLDDPLIPLNKVTDLVNGLNLEKLDDNEKALMNMLKPNYGFSAGIHVDTFYKLIDQDKEAIKLRSQFNRFENPTVNDSTIFGLEGVKVAVELKKLSETEKDKQYSNIYVIDTTNDTINKETLHNCVAELLKQVPETGVNRAQILVKGVFNHFTTIDLHLEKDNCQCIVLDALNDTGQFNYAIALSKFDEIKTVYLATKLSNQSLQKDGKSCTIFSLDQAFSLTELPNIYKELNQNTVKSESDANKIVHVTWDKFPPILVKNAQSKEVLEHYKGLNAGRIDEPFSDKTTETLTQYLEKHCSTITENNKSTFRNNANIALFEAFKKQYEDFLSSPDYSAKSIFDMVKRKEAYKLTAKASDDVQQPSNSPPITTSRTFADAYSNSKFEVQQQNIQEQQEEKVIIKAKDSSQDEQVRKKQKTDGDEENTNSSAYRPQ